MLSFTALNYKDFVGSLYHKKPILSDEFTHFECALRTYKENFYQNAHQNEDALVANALAPFLQNLGFKTHVKEKQQGNSEIDLAVMKEDKVGIIIEAKKGYAKKMFSAENVNCEALHEAILYYLRQRNTDNGGGVFKNSISPNSSLKFIIITNFTHFYFFKANEFERLFYKNKEFADLYANFTSVNSIFKGNTKEFYKETEKILATLNDNIKGFHLDLSQLKTDTFDFKIGQIPFKVFHKDFLLDEFNPNDANSLNEHFYKELLYILGLQEKKDDSKLLIVPSADPKNAQNTLYNAIITKLPKDKQDLESTMNFIVLWLNRILFLKLIEANLVRFNDDANLKFLNLSKVPNFKALSQLFFDILAKKPQNRTQANSALAYLPYLNSSLFVRQKCENLLDISALDDSATLSYYAHTQIKDKNAKAKVGKVGLLAYLFEFLDSFDFGSNEDSAELALQKELISSSVLGLVFEKLNGYKEGSFYTPSFITSYMAKTSLEKIVLDKFANIGLKAKDLSELKGQIVANLNADYSFMQKAKDVLLSIKICDPAVGSGHFLVSALNEMIKIYHTLGLSELSAYHLHLNNDEIIITKPNGKIYEYKKPTTTNDENHAIQKALFALKKSIIENNLFGVDINANSVQICRLRLWIELLKSSYYLDEKDENFKPNLLPKIHQMQTLPNIDINIKCGNSLISRFDLKNTLATVNNVKVKITEYKQLVKDYKNGHFTSKQDLEDKINEIKASFTLTLKDDKTKKKLENALDKHIATFGHFLLSDENILDGLNISSSKNLFNDEIINNLSEQDKQKAAQSIGQITLLSDTLKSSLSGESFKNAFEWRFEFPEVLDENGDFMGFDLVIGNPPYIKEADNKALFKNTKHLRTYQGKMDIWYHFASKGFDLVKNQGIVTFIATNNWTTNSGAKKLRNVILRESQILNLVDFGAYMCFDKANIQTMIMEFRKTKSIPKSYAINYSKIISKKPTDKHVEALLNRNIFDNNIYLTPIIMPKKLIDMTLTFTDSQIDLALNKICKNGKFYLQKNEIWQGLVHPQPILDKNMVVKLKQQNKFYNVGNGVFNLNINEINKLNLSKKEKSLLKPYYKADNLLKYYGDKRTDTYVIYTDSSFKNPKSMDNYPNLKKHLDEFQSIITSDNKPYGLHRARKQDIFEGNKILSRVKCVDCPIFTYADFDCYVGLNFNIIKTNRIDLKYLIGLLNSKLIAFWLKHKGKMQGNNYQINQEPLIKIPIAKPSSKNQKIADKIISLVDKILALKSKNAEADTSELEKQIDSLVYELYDLSSDEITIIEGK